MSMKWIKKYSFFLMILVTGMIYGTVKIVRAAGDYQDRKAQEQMAEGQTGENQDGAEDQTGDDSQNGTKPGEGSQIGDGSRTRITRAATSANLARILYSRRIKVFAPSRISAETSWILALPVFCFLTHKYR